jgi:hypothetical protein
MRGQRFLESLRQEAESQFFYGDVATAPEKIKGLAARYNATGGGGAGNQIVKAGGSGSVNTSVWFVTWGENATHLIHPQGTPAGIDRQDKGEQRVYDSNNNPYYVKEELFRWHLGVAVRDWRYNARIANIDTTASRREAVDIYAVHAQGFLQAAGHLRDGDAQRGGAINPNASVEGRTVIYMNRTVLEALDATHQQLERRADAAPDGARRAGSSSPTAASRSRFAMRSSTPKPRSADPRDKE